MSDSRPPRVLVVSTSLSGKSRSRQLCRCASDVLRSLPGQHPSVDLRDHRVLPYGMDGGEGYDTISAALSLADGVILGLPVYNYTMSSSCKALIEHFGDRLEGKVVGLLLSAGGRASYMSAAGVMVSLMFDFRSWMVPRVVYATKADFVGQDQSEPGGEIRDRVRQLAEVTYRAAWQLSQPVPGL